MRIDKRLLAWAAGVRALLAVTVALGVLGGLCMVAQARYLSTTVNQVFLNGATLNGVAAMLLAFVLAGLGRAAALWGSEAAAGRAAVQVKNDVRGRLLAHLQQLGPAYVRGERTGELVNTATEGVEALDAYFSQYLPQLALAALVPLLIAILVVPLDPISGLVLVLTAPLIPLFMVLAGGLSDAVTRKQWASLSRLSAHFLDVLQGLATLKIFGRSRAQIEIIARISDEYRQTTMGVLRVAFLSALLLEMVATISTAVVAVEIGVRLLYGRLALEQALFILILAPEFYQPLRSLGQRFHAGVAGVTAAQRIFDVLEAPVGEVGRRRPEYDPQGKPQREGCEGHTARNTRRDGAEGLARQTAEVAGSDERQPGKAVPVMLRHPPRVRFEDVYYAYEDGRAALRGVSFDMLPGQRTALVGPTGSGKSTVAQLLLRFIEPQAGQIWVEGRPLAEQLAAEWRRLVAWVPQNPYLFAGTVADNIRLGQPDATQDELMMAAEQAQADKFITALPDGYQTVLGERGARLSGGQAQRIALARAFLKDAPLLILDEATANLDPASEAAIRTAIERLLQGRSALIITHRLNTVASADQILVLAQGRIQEAGAHADLLARGGMYQRLVAAWQSGRVAP